MFRGLARTRGLPNSASTRIEIAIAIRYLTAVHFCVRISNSGNALPFIPPRPHFPNCYLAIDNHVASFRPTVWRRLLHVHCLTPWQEWVKQLRIQ